MPPSIESKRKKERACDACRKRKTKCDGPWVPNNICTNCLQTHKSCTYLEASKPRGPPKAYITGLEDRLEALESLVNKIRPGVDFSDELGPPIIRDSWKNQNEQHYQSATTTTTLSITKQPSSSTLPQILIPQTTPNTHASLSSALVSSISPCSTHLTFGPHSHPERSKKDFPPNRLNYRDSNKFSDDNTSSDYSSSPSDTEDTIVTSLVGRMKMTLKVAEQDSDPEDDGCIRFHGRISTAGLVEVARQFKHMHFSPDQGSPSSPDNSTVAQTRRPVFWRTAQWESVEDADETHLPSLLSHFPPIELCRQLVELYFRHCNTLYPLLHRPTFDRQWSNGLYRRNIWFAAVCMLVFAIGSSWTDDKRVLPANALLENGALDWTQTGRHYFEAALDMHWLRRSYLHPSSLFEVQTFALISMYLRANDDASAAWMYVSLGLRKAQDVGAHRKKVYRDQINTDDELWKRAFWHLVIFDRMGSISLGRPPCLGEEDFDLDFPVEVDDEYWEAESTQFKQPPGIPSLVAAFNQMIRLSKISAFASCTLYAIDRPVAFKGVNTPTRAGLGKQLSQALQIWVDNVPDHLKWRSDFQDTTMAQQSSTIFTSYHMTRILVHRCFILAPSTTSLHNQQATFITEDPAAVVCLEAVRACAHIIRNDRSKSIEPLDTPHLGSVAHACGAFLLVVIWSLKLQEKELQSRGIYDIKPPVAQRMEWMMNDIQFFTDTLEKFQKRWRICAAMLSELRDLMPRPLEDDKSPMAPGHSPLVLEHADSFEVSSRFAVPIPSIHSNSSVMYPSQPLRDSYLRDELPKARRSDNDLKASPHDQDPAFTFIQNRHPEWHKTHTLPQEQAPAYHGDRVEFSSSSIPPVLPSSFRSIHHEHAARKIDNLSATPSERPFPYISTSMRRASQIPSNNLDQEYTRYPQARISGIRSNLTDGPTSDAQDLVAVETDYTPISRHARQYDHHPTGIYPDYLQHAK
ncbi:fungal-specific transcription factor domain-containing protein [Panaeolus papilionaceus]|nr:fungal-specific transcription factor domain-containing protein [Panaeolus papilionaceus]